MKKEVDVKAPGKVKKGKVEKKTSGHRLPYGFIGKMLLASVATAGILTIALAAPNIFQAVRAIEKHTRRNHRRYRSIASVRKTVNSLAKQGLITVFEQKDGVAMRLTDKGRRELLKYQLKEKSLKKWHWDKKWRLLIFDIPEKRRWARDRVRTNMQDFGFVQVQESVWAYPYECEQVVTLLKADCKIGKEMLYITAGEIENDVWLKKNFNLE